MSELTHKTVVGSLTNRPNPAEFTRLKPTPGKKLIPFTLRAKMDMQSADPLQVEADVLSGKRPMPTLEEINTIFDIAPATKQKLIDTAIAHGFIPVKDAEGNISYDKVLRLLDVVAPADTVRTECEIELFDFRVNSETLGKKVFTGREGEIKLPNDLHALVVSVHGIDARPTARTRHRVLGTMEAHDAKANVSYSPVAALERTNTPLKAGNYGAGMSCGFGSLSGEEGGAGEEETNRHNIDQGLQPMKDFKTVLIDGAKVNPNPNPSGSVMEDRLDLQMLAPNFNAMIRQIIGQNTTASLAKLFTTAASLGLMNFSLSWGQYESGWTNQDFDLCEDAFAVCKSRKMNLLGAAGDAGVTDRDPANGINQDYPAMSRRFISVAGVTDPGKPNFAGVKVWNEYSPIPELDHGESGGGVAENERFPLSDGQLKLQAAGFKMPMHLTKKTDANGKPWFGRVCGDIAFIGNPKTGVQVMQPNGSKVIIGGTSVGAPAENAKCTSIGAAVGHQFDYADTLYTAKAAGKDLCTPVTVGNNSNSRQGYEAENLPFSAIGGCGMPDGGKVVAYLQTGNAPAPTTGKGKKHGGKRKAA